MLSRKVDNKADWTFEMYSNPLVKFVWFSLISEKTCRMTSGVKRFPLCTHIKAALIKSTNDFLNGNSRVEGNGNIRTWKFAMFFLIPNAHWKIRRYAVFNQSHMVWMTLLVSTLISRSDDLSWISINQLFQSEIADEELQVQRDSIDLNSNKQSLRGLNCYNLFVFCHYF